MDLDDLRRDAPRVVGRLVPGYEKTYERLGWRMFPGIERVYVNARARQDLGWRPRCDFGTALARLQSGEDWRSPLARAIGAKGYHDRAFAEGPYPVLGEVGQHRGGEEPGAFRPRHVGEVDGEPMGPLRDDPLDRLGHLGGRAHELDVGQ